ncbi:MAG: hypothetical protein PWP27_1084 [Clostridiales bacterium]|nr:hypothetical protein [Clostridiales bacterium]MDK2933274.1 hypothetical protein [Clostridiales bacterium]
MILLNTLTDIILVKSFINNNKLSLILIKAKNCGVCDAVLVKLEQLVQKYPKIKSSIVSIEQVPEVSGNYLVFTAPTVLFFVEGKEVLRESRFIRFNELENVLKRWCDEFC